MGPLNLATGPASTKVRVQPSVLLSICDAYVRRNSKHRRVVGTLLGFIGDGGVVEVRNCYAVPHNDQDQSVSLLSSLQQLSGLLWHSICFSVLE